MKLNKRELSEKLGVSETTLTDWQRKGLPSFSQAAAANPASTTWPRSCAG